MKSVTVSLVSGFAYQQSASNGKHSITLDVDTTVGGADGGMDPKDAVLSGLGACIAMTLIMVAKKKQYDLQSISVKVTLDEEDDPDNAGKKRFVVTEEIECKGNLSQAELTALESNVQKCPVSKFLLGPKRMVSSIALGK